MSSSRKKQLLRVFSICGGFYLLACIGCASFQRRLIYFPPHYSSSEAAQLAAGNGMERWISSDGKALGWKRLHRGESARGSVLISHGNACCAFECSHFADSIQAVALFDIFIVEYPGYGDCSGTPTETSIDNCAANAFVALPANRPIYLVGESLGTGVAAYLAGKYPERVAGIALLAPYPCLADVAQAHMRIIPVRWLLSEHFPAQENLRAVHAPLAVLVGGRDTVVPKKFGVRLYNNYAGPKRLWEFPQLDHDSLMEQPPAVWKEIINFWEEGR